MNRQRDPVLAAREHVDGLRESGRLAGAVAGWRRVAHTSGESVAWEGIVEALYEKTWDAPFTEAVAAAYCREIGLERLALVTLANGTTMPREQRWIALKPEVVLHSLTVGRPVLRPAMLAIIEVMAPQFMPQFVAVLDADADHDTREEWLRWGIAVAMRHELVFSGDYGTNS